MVTLAVLDKDKNYLIKLEDMIHKKFDEQLCIFTYTEPSKAIRDLEKNKVNFFLASERFHINKNLLPEECSFVYLTESPQTKEVRGERVIFKYQRIQSLYKDITNLESILNKKILVFCSSAGGSTIAAACAVRMASRKKRVLYLNFEQLGDAGFFFQQEGVGSLYDAISFLRQKEDNLDHKLEHFIKQDKTGVFFLENSRAMDFANFSKQEITQFMGLLKKMSFDTIIIDADFLLDDKSEALFRTVTHLIFVSNGTIHSNFKYMKAKEALAELSQMLHRDLISKTYIVYNRFQNNSSTLKETDAKSLGTILEYEDLKQYEVMEQIASTRLFDEL